MSASDRPAERGRLVLPLRGEPGDRRRRQARAGAQELLQRRPEVGRGQPVQIQQRQHLGHPRATCATRPAGSPRRTAPARPVASSTRLSLTRGARTAHRPGRGGHLPRLVVAVADHQPPAVLVDLVGVRLDVGRDLRLQRRRQHPPRPVADDLIQQRRARHLGRVVAPRPRLDYLEHGRTFPNQRANAGPDQN